MFLLGILALFCCLLFVSFCMSLFVFFCLLLMAALGFGQQNLTLSGFPPNAFGSAFRQEVIGMSF